jgi:hypothetical protein
MNCHSCRKVGRLGTPISSVIEFDIYNGTLCEEVSSSRIVEDLFSDVFPEKLSAPAETRHWNTCDFAMGEFKS